MKAPHFSFLDWKKLLVVERLVPLTTGLLIFFTSAYLLTFLYHNVVRILVFPKPVEEGQVTQRLEKVNRGLLKTITEKNDVKRTPTDASSTPDPFAP